MPGTRSNRSRGGFNPTVIITMLCIASGCGDTGPSGHNNNHCPPGHEPRNRACIPVFDPCPGPTEIPELGGGCLSIAVTQCATGFASDTRGGCDPILPTDPCPAATMEVLGETTCRSVGVTSCATGFVSDNEGGCEPVLPEDTCSATTMETLGQTTCRPIALCGTGTWGLISTGTNTVFVDAAYSGGNSDGSEQAPFLTIAEALAVVAPLGQIAVAAGHYAERLDIDKPIRVDGRCPELVTIRGIFDQGVHRPPIRIGILGSGATVRGVTLTGDAEGLSIEAAGSVAVERVLVVNTGSMGIALASGAEVDLRSVVVDRAVGRGIYSDGCELSVSDSVVRNTQPDSALLHGRGIQAVCDPNTGLCGALTVHRTVIRSNREAGIIVFGVDSVVTASVIQDTLGRQSDGLYGRGIHAECDPLVLACGTFDVTGCVVAANRDAGIQTSGVRAAVSSTTVRDTGPNQDDRFGHGIQATCSPYMDSCGSLAVEHALIRGNRDLGIATYSVDTTVYSTIVRDTLPTAAGLSGRGIYAECDPAPDACGNLSVAFTLVERNTDAGISILGMDTTVRGSVVRDTQPRPIDGASGRGIVAGCQAQASACPRFRLDQSLVTENHEVGVLCAGAEVTVTGSLVRNTRPRADDASGGQGIHAQCDVGLQACGNLSVVSSVVASNRDMGIAAAGVDTHIASTVVRDTEARLGDGRFGRGVEAQCDPDLERCPTLAVTDSLLDSNRDESVFVSGGDAVIARTVVRDSLAQESDQLFGRGINAQCDPDLQACGSLEVTDSLVTNSRNNGVVAAGVRTALNGVTVVDTRPNDQGDWADDYGQAVFAFCFPGTGWCGRLEMTGCVIRVSHSAGVAILGVPGFLRSSLIQNVAARPLDQAFGYGIQMESLDDRTMINFDVDSCRIQDAVLAGALYARAGGTLSGTAISGGAYAVVAGVGSAPDLADDNDLEGAFHDGLYWGHMDPSPAPAPALPAELE